MLPLDTFKSVIKNSPLISIDLIVKNKKGEVLLGKRNYRPAQGSWFVPGGRILKDESFEQAFQRLLSSELGIESSASKFLGVYQHFYDDNFSEEKFSTHYVVLAYEILFESDVSTLPVEQHSDYAWFDESKLLLDANVHLHSKWYFQDNKQADTLYK